MFCSMSRSFVFLSRKKTPSATNKIINEAKQKPDLEAILKLRIAIEKSLSSVGTLASGRIRFSTASTTIPVKKQAIVFIGKDSKIFKKNQKMSCAGSL
ncbi:hypothetical protein D3C86_1213670 [compost metagenome]